MDRDYTIDWSGPNRITWVTNDLINDAQRGKGVGSWY